MQKTLLRGWRGFAALGEEAAGYAWLRRILQTVIAEQARRAGAGHHGDTQRADRPRLRTPSGSDAPAEGMAPILQ